MTGRKDPAVLGAALTAQVERVERWLPGPPGAAVPAALVGRFRAVAGVAGDRNRRIDHDRSDAGPLAERVVRVVALSDDLARSVPDHPGPDLDRAAVRIAVRTLLDRLAENAPGRSVEVRVPPYAAVQCVAGTRHTRGTPPSVVETDPVSWIRLATGRAEWADLVATGAVSATGERCDLSRYLPVLAPDPRPPDAH